ncbi:formylglycine-generating enzyme family protein [Microbulbifer pacificus]|uniref:formylglycine-generating enzyme family protein n=1 Tax=Microbulbifer pacificus TaxID=407164 RepID=UPI000CF4DF6A|nr:SUMF1/EgtB/PvdO family nonheme iron enzyme [Microbulbifer pacificus]
MVSRFAFFFLTLTAVFAGQTYISGPFIPEGMAYIPSGITKIGEDFDSGPRVHVREFLLDSHPVTVGDFKKFASATGYATLAEVRGGAMVYEDETDTWKFVENANWLWPRGPDRERAISSHPVTQVSWFDAEKYASWAGKRLPTEFEWEHAARNGENSRKKYSWGDNFLGYFGNYRGNTRHRKYLDSGRGDGYHYTSPVDAFTATSRGLLDMTGNVLEWTASNCTPGRSYGGLDCNRNSEIRKILKGGSFLCEREECRIAKSHSFPPESVYFHVGFRLAKDIDQ